MICRLWRGWTTEATADTYEHLLRSTVVPGILRRELPGFQAIDLLRRSGPDGVEFVTLMWFDSVEAVRRFAGPDYEVAVVPPEARQLLARFDKRSAHYTVTEREGAGSRRCPSPNDDSHDCASTKEDSIMTAMEIGEALVALCRQGKNVEAIEKFYSPTIESMEPFAHPQIGQVQKGIDAVKGKNQWWVDNHQVHKVEVNGPFPNGDQFIVHFTYDVTPKQTGKRMTLSETGLFTVRDGKIAQEAFFYTM